ncbi:MAG: sodium:solute symporter [Pirellulaceae bacterium]
MSEQAAAALSRTNFSTLDWGIVIAYLAISVAIGLLVRKYATTMTAYIVAGRGLGVWLGIATMAGTEMGLITVMYSAEKGFKGGFAAFHIAVLAGIVTFMVGLTGFIVAPLRELGVLTIPEYYERRYGRKTRVLGGVMLAFGGILNMGLFLKVGSMFIVGVTGMSQEGWALAAVMSVLLLLVLVYTVLGGMISVVLTDYVQFVVLSFGLLITTVIAVAKLGWQTIFDTVQDRMGSAGLNPLESEGAFGVEYVLWMAFLGLVSCALWPTAVARALAMESTEAVKKQYRWSALSFTVRLLVPYFWGICAFVFIVTQAPDLAPLFGLGEESLAESETVSSLYAMPIFIGRILPAGLLGLMSAAMIAAFMSTHDSYLLCWSSVLVQDVIAPLRKEPLSTLARVKLTRILIVVIGAYIWVWGLFYTGSDDIWDYMAITGAIYFTGAFALLAGGLYWKQASSTGAFCALLAGFTAILGLGPVREAVGGRLLSLLGWDATPKAVDAVFGSARVGLGTICFTLIVYVVGSLLWPDPKPRAKTNA